MSRGNDGDIELYGSKYLALSALGGALACGLSHVSLTPLDHLKCRMQADTTAYAVKSGLNSIYCQCGIRGLYKGWLPTLLGYGLHGATRFSAYEYFKYKYADMAGEENAYVYRTLLNMAAAGSAEVLGTLLLAPFEAAKIKMQSIAGYTYSMGNTFRNINCCEGGLNGFYRGLLPLLARQVPYTMMKFAIYEKTVDLLYSRVVPKPEHECYYIEKVMVAFAAGYVTGVFTALVSHPADFIVTRVYHEPCCSVEKVVRCYWSCIWIGLKPRMLMLGTLAGMQWVIYDRFLCYLNMPRPPIGEMPSSLKKKGYY